MKNIEEKYKVRFYRIKVLFWIALVAAPLFLGAKLFDTTTTIASTLQVLAILCALPFMIYVYCITILHWKDRYIGKHSDLWGILLLIETSGWFKIIYFFRHLLPDMHGVGRREITTDIPSIVPIDKTSDHPVEE